MKRKVILAAIGLLIVLTIFLLVWKVFFDKDLGSIKTASVVDKIEKYNYSLDDRDSELFEEGFKELKSILNEDEINYEEYARVLAKLYVIDLYTINNKINKYDVGSLEYVHPNIVESFKLKVQDTLYKYVVDNSDDKRSQVLPEVKAVMIDDYEKDTYEIEKEEFESYKLLISWEYEKDLEYDKKGEIIIIKDNDGKLQIVDVQATNEN